MGVCSERPGESESPIVVNEGCMREGNPGTLRYGCIKRNNLLLKYGTGDQ